MAFTVKPRRWGASLLIVALLVLLAGCEWGTEEDAGTPPETVTVVPVPGPGPDVTLDEGVEQTQLERPEGVDAHEDARDETPPGVTPEDVEQIEESRPDGLGPPQPLGGAENLSCPKRIVRNHSARASGSRVSMVVLHYTVSAPGTLGVIRGLFDTPSFGASSHIGLEGSGECQQWVEYGRKAWTQGAFNSVADSVEIIARGTETRAWWLRQPIIRDGLLASWIVDRLRARGLPPRRVNPSGCTPLAGWTDHEALECGNTHTDVRPAFPYDVVQRQVVARFAPEPTRITVWRVAAGGKILHQRKVVRGANPTTYSLVAKWLREHPRPVVAAEAEHGIVTLRKITVAVP